MPIHDWRRVTPGIYHAFQISWIVQLQNALNNGILPESYYALAEQLASDISPSLSPESLAPLPLPVTRFTASVELDAHAFSRQRVVVRQEIGDRPFAVIDVLSPGNKFNRYALGKFLRQTLQALQKGLHLLLVDLFPPGRHDPHGIHGSVWGEFTDAPPDLPANKPLTLASYASGQSMAAYVEPVNVAEKLPDMPLFLTPDAYVPVPLEATYQEAWKGVPQRWKRVLEAPAS